MRLLRAGAPPWGMQRRAMHRLTPCYVDAVPVVADPEGLCWARIVLDIECPIGHIVSYVGTIANLETQMNIMRSPRLALLANPLSRTSIREVQQLVPSGRRHLGRLISPSIVHNSR